MLRSCLSLWLGYAWFTQTIFQDIWRASISWVFLFIAGWMCTLSRNNIKRAVKYAAAAFVVWVATTLVSVDDSVNFGIMFCMAACTAIVALARPVIVKVPSVWGIAICLTLFTLTWSIPKTVYPIPYLAWLGFPSPDFVSGDYYPVIPFLFMYLAGFFAAHMTQEANYEAPDGPMRIPSRRSQVSGAMRCRSTCFINRLSWVYWS